MPSGFSLRFQCHRAQTISPEIFSKNLFHFRVGKFVKTLSHLQRRFRAIDMRLESFLWFYDLELGGIIIGFYHLIIYCLLVLAAVISFFVAPLYCELKIDQSLHSMTQLLRITDPDTNLILLAVGIIVYILLSCVLVWLSWQLIMGVEFVSR